MILFPTVKNKFILHETFNFFKTNTMKTIFIPLLLLLSFSLNTVAQEKSRREKRGDKYIFTYSYDKAIVQYNKADELTISGKRNLAESYAKTNQDVQAELIYRSIVNENSSVVAEDYYNYAMILKSTGNYRDAFIWMDKFQVAAPNDLRAISYRNNKSELETLLANNEKNSIEHLKFNTNIQEFGPAYYKNNIMYASGQTHASFIKRKNNQNGEPYLDIYYSEINGDQLKESKKFNSHFNNKFNDGPVSFSKDYTYMAYTRNTVKDKTKDKIVELQIWFSTLVDDKWSKEEAFIFNNPNYSVGHPFLTKDGNTMYFASDMPGGFGNADLYKTTKNAQGVWTKPMNLGNTINTEGDELFPYVEEKNEVLLFTSNGHFGLGGMDLFMSQINGSEFSEVQNLGAPINTKQDDFAMIYEPETKKAYFSSDRNGNDDIYTGAFSEGLDLKKKIKGIAIDKNGNLLPNTLITLSDDKGNTLDTLTTLDEGAFSFLVKTDQYFSLVGTKDKYLPGKQETNTFGTEEVITANVTLLQQPTKVVDETFVNTETEVKNLDNSIVFKPIYFDLNKYNIRTDAKKLLDELIIIMNRNPDMVIRLSSYTDSRDTEKYNQLLSERRANATLAYIKKRITNPDRITGKGYGEELMVNGCVGEGTVLVYCSEEDHQKNRRSEFVIVSNTTMLMSR